jgi:hypothetical protein
VQRHQVGFAVAAALIFAIFLVFGGSGAGLYVIRIAEAAFRSWFVGATLLAVALVLRWRKIEHGAVQVLGAIGCAWVGAVIAWPFVFIVVWALTGPHGP